MRDAGAGAAPALLEVDRAPLLPRSRTLERLRPRRRWTASRSCSRRYEHDGPRRHLATAFVDLDDLDGVAAARSPAGRRGCPRRVAVVDLYAGTPAGAAGDELAAQLRAALAGVDAARQRAARRRRRRAARRAAAACRRSTRSRSGPAATGSSRTSSLRGLHPMMARAAATCGGCRSSRSSACRRPRTSTSSAASRRANPKDERLFALAEVRDLTPVRDEAGRVVALPELERMLVEALEAHPPLPGAPPAERAPAVEPRPAERLAGDRPHARGARRADRRGSRRRPRASGIEMVLVRGPHARAPTARCATACCASSRPPGDGVVVEVDEPPTRAAAAARRGRAADRRSAPARLLHPAELVKLLAPRAAPSGRPARRASSSSTTSTPTAALVPVDRPPATNQAGIVVGADPQRHRAPPRGHAARGPARRPDAGARLARRAGVPADHRRARPRRGARRAARVVRALRRREDRDGQRHREHGLDRRGAAPDHRVHPGRRRDQRRRRPASTSARSRTGTPRRRCSCTRAASWS